MNDIDIKDGTSNDAGNKHATLRAMPQPSDLNINGNIFGGWVLSQMDIAGFIAAREKVDGPIATIAVKSMKFFKPINAGDLVSLYASIEKVGTTSITVAIDVYADPVSTFGKGKTKAQKVTEGQFVYVALDEKGNPRKIEE